MPEWSILQYSSPQTDNFDLLPLKIGPLGPPPPPPQKRDYFDNKISDKLLKSLIDEAIKRKEKQKSKNFSTDFINEMDKELKIDHNQLRNNEEDIYKIKSDKKDWRDEFKKKLRKICILMITAI